jgi:sentrin-specific protease 8
MLVDTAGELVPVVQEATPMQPNDYDCGVYVMAVARAIGSWWRDKGSRGSSGHWFQALTTEVDASSVRMLRVELEELIRSFLSKEKAKA